MINSVTHEPVGHAQVYSGDNRFAVMTDDQGRFEFVLPPSGGTSQISLGLYNLVARKPGFLYQPNRSLPSAKISQPGELTLFLTPEAIIMGRISLPGEDAPDGVQVQLYQRLVRDGLGHWVSQASAQSNSQGEFRFAELPAGTYRLGTREVPDRDPEDATPGGTVFGYPPIYFPAAASFFGAESINLAPGQIFEADLTLTRQQYYPVKIAVANTAAEQGMGINVSAEGDGVPGYSLGRGPDHTIRGFLPSGNYLLEATSYGQQMMVGMLNLTIANAPAESARLTLLPAGSISVNVKEEFSKPDPTPPTEPRPSHGHGFSAQGPRRYLNVNLEPANDFRNAYASLLPPTGSNDEGLALGNVQPGTYWVRATSSRGYIASVTSGGVDLEHHPLVVGPGGSSPAIEIAVRDDTASFDGTVEGVSDSSDRSTVAASAVSSGPAAFVYCIPEADSPGQFTLILTQGDGKFNSPEMPPGAYRVLAFQRPQDDLEYRNPQAMRAYESKGVLLNLAPGEKQSLQLQLVNEAGTDAQ